MAVDENIKELSAHIRPVPTYLVDRENLSSYNSQPAELFPAAQPLQDYFRIFLTYRWLVLSVSFITLALSLLYSFLATPMYTAETKVKIGTYSPSVTGAEFEDILRQQTQEQDYLQTQIELLSSYSLVDKVLTEGGLDQDLKHYFSRKTAFFSITEPLLKLFSKAGPAAPQVKTEGDYHHPQSVIRGYLDLVSIIPVRKTSLVRVSVTTADPLLSAKIANAHAQAFIELVRSERQQNTVESLVFLKSQAEELADKVALAERNIAAYAEENAIVSVNKDENIVVRRMGELSDLLTQATAVRIKAESAYNEAKSGSGLSSTSLDDEAISRLRSSLKEAEAEYAMLSEKFKPGYPRMVQLNARITDLKQNLKEQRTQAISALQAQYNASVQNEEELKRQLEIQKSKAFDLSRREVQFNIMKREYDSLKDLHQSVLRQLKESQMTSESRGTNINVIDRAAVPLDHSSPKRLFNALAALIFGPLLGFALAFVIEALDNTVKTPDQVQDLLQLPVLGVVPAFTGEDLAREAVEPNLLIPNFVSGSDSSQADEDASPSPYAGFLTPPSAPVEPPLFPPAPVIQLSNAFVTLGAPQSIASESFRAIRTGILLSSADRPPRVILITSAKKSEGKTTLAANLAITLAQSSHKTLLIDADLRRPSVSRHFGIDPETPGLVDCLTGQKDAAQVVYPSGVDNLFVIPSGPKPPNPAELIGSRTMAEVLSRFSEDYQYVLIDTPPVLPVTDAVVLSRIVDGVVLVVRGQDTQKQVAKDAASRLRQVGAKVLGVVLNDVNVRSGHYYYYYRDAYADYYAEDKARRSRA